MKSAILAMIERFGREVSVAGDEGSQTKVKAYLQAIIGTNRQHMQSSHTPAGFDERGSYLYIGPAEVEIKRKDRHGEIVDSFGKIYTVQRDEVLFFKDAALYRWAILREKALEVVSGE